MGTRFASLVLVAFTSCAHCQPAPPPTDRAKVNAAFERANLILTQDPASWYRALDKLEGELVDLAPTYALSIGQLKVEARLIENDGPKECRAWVRSFLPSALSYVRARANGASASTLPLNPVCPQREAEREPDGSYRVAAFVSSFADLPRPTSQYISAGSGDPVEVMVLPATAGYSLLFKTGVECSPEGGRLLLDIGESSSAFSLAIKRDRDPWCVRDAEQELSAELLSCERDCCRYPDVGTCVKERCEAECRLRNETNPSGHPAIGDACSTSGAFYQWCRRDCSENSSCRAQWCSDDAPSRSSCIASAKSTYEARKSECPIVAEGCGTRTKGQTKATFQKAAP